MTAHHETQHASGSWRLSGLLWVLTLILAAATSWALAMWISATSARAAEVAQPSDAPLTSAQARHLLVRTGFAPPPAAVDALVGRPRSSVIDELIQNAKNRQTQTPAPKLSVPDPVLNTGTPEQRQAVRREQTREGLDIKAWWVQEMLDSPAPLAERMTLFWHSHFATSQQKVLRSVAIWNQHQTLRTNALTSFGPMLHAISKDPAMLVYLDGANSRKEAPNENFAREVMELFTLGEASAGGGYTERDIKEAARAFTGWSIERADFSYRFRPALNDTGDKQVLGKTVKTGEQVLDLLIAHPATARHLMGKLWKEFVSEQPSSAQEQADFDAAVRAFAASGLDTSAVLRSLLASPSFWDERNRLALIKSPLDYVVGMVRQFGVAGADAMPLALASAQFGQNLLYPPNVKGWPGNKEWINATTLLDRKRFAEQIFATRPRAPSQPMAMPADGGMMAAPPPVSQAASSPMLTAEGGAAQGRGSVLQAIRLIGQTDGKAAAQRTVGGIAALKVPVESVLAGVGAGVDRVPDADAALRLATLVLATQPTFAIADGTVGVAYLRALVLDPAYQLK